MRSGIAELNGMLSRGALSDTATWIAVNVRKGRTGSRWAGTLHAQLHDLRVCGAGEAASLGARTANRKEPLT